MPVVSRLQGRPLHFGAVSGLSPYLVRSVLPAHRRGFGPHGCWAVHRDHSRWHHPARAWRGACDFRLMPDRSRFRARMLLSWRGDRLRTEETRVGQTGVSTFNTSVSPFHKKKKIPEP